MIQPDGPFVTVVGSINMDLVSTTAELPAPGQTVLGATFRTVPGGKGANQAIAAARAGGRVAFVGAVGSDAFADDLSASLSDAGVDIAGLRAAPGPSGIAAIAVDSHGENTIIVIPGANDTVRLDDTDLATIGRSDICVLQLEIPLDTVIDAAQTAAAASVPVLLNPSPATTLPSVLLDAVTVLVLNEGEAEAVGDVRRVPHVVTTLGRRGARYRGLDGTVIETPSPAVDSIDSTGAGDAFTGAFAVAWAQDRTPLDALRFACAAGALATTEPGAGTSPSRERIEALVAGRWGEPAR